MSKDEIIKEFLEEEIESIEYDIIVSVRNSYTEGEGYDRETIDELMNKILLLESYL